jgi:hypothetical protein
VRSDLLELPASRLGWRVETQHCRSLTSSSSRP